MRDLPGASFDRITTWLLTHQSCIPAEHAEAYRTAMSLAFQPGTPLPDVFNQAAKHAPAAQDSNRAASAAQKAPKVSSQKKPSPPREKAAAGAPVNLSRAAASYASDCKLKTALPAQDGNTAVAAASSPAVTTMSSYQTAKGSSQAAASDGASSSDAAPCPSKKPAGDQLQPRGLAKGFFSKSSGLGGKSTSPASSVYQAKPAPPEASKAKRSADGILLEVPESWFSRNREVDHVIAASLRELEKRLLTFRGHYDRRSAHLQRLLGNWEYLDYAVRHHLLELRAMCRDIENAVCDFVALQNELEVDGPYAVSRSEDLQQDIRGIHIPQSYESSIAGVEDMLEMYRVSMHCY